MQEEAVKWVVGGIIIDLVQSPTSYWSRKNHYKVLDKEVVYQRCSLKKFPCMMDADGQVGDKSG